MQKKLSMSALMEYLRRPDRKADTGDTEGDRLASALEQLTTEIRASAALRHSVTLSPRPLHIVPFTAGPATAPPETTPERLLSGRFALPVKIDVHTRLDEFRPHYFIVDPDCDCRFRMVHQHYLVFEEAHSSMFWPGRVGSESLLVDQLMAWGRLPHQQPDLLLEAGIVRDGEVSEWRTEPLQGVVLAEQIVPHVPISSLCGTPGFR